MGDMKRVSLLWIHNFGVTRNLIVTWRFLLSAHELMHSFFFRARDKDLNNYAEMWGAVLQNLVYRATRLHVFVHVFRNVLLRVSFEEIFASEFE